MINQLFFFNRSCVSAQVMMVEADVMLGTVKGSADPTEVPIMSHPPDKTSDLTFREFLEKSVQVLEDNLS